MAFPGRRCGLLWAGSCGAPLRKQRTRRGRIQPPVGALPGGWGAAARPLRVATDVTRRGGANFSPPPVEFYGGKNATADHIHCPLAEIHRCGDRMQASARRMHSTRRRIDPSGDRKHCPRGETHSMRRRINSTPQRMHPFRGRVNATAQHLPRVRTSNRRRA